MSIDRMLWKAALTHEEVPTWPCPKCSVPALGYAVHKHRKDALLQGMSADSQRICDNANYGPEYDRGYFAALLVCKQRSCGEHVTVCGSYDVDIDYAADGFTVAVPTFRPSYFHPALPMLNLPSTVPSSVRSELADAFASYWGDSSACLNHIRQSVEALLSEFKVPLRKWSKPKTGKGRLRRLFLSDRIDIAPNRLRLLLNEMHALRILGNAGSHVGEVTKDNCLDGLELVGHILEELYYPRHKRLSRITKSILKTRKKKSPTSP